MIALPPSELGALKLTVAEAFAAVALVMDGEPGTVACEPVPVVVLSVAVVPLQAANRARAGRSRRRKGMVGR